MIKDLNGKPLKFGDTVVVVWRRVSHRRERPQVVAGVLVPSAPGSSELGPCVFNYGVFDNNIKSYIFTDDDIDLLYVCGPPNVLDKYGNPLSLGDYIKYDHANLKFEGVLKIGLDASTRPYFYVEQVNGFGRTIETKIQTGEDLELILE